MLMEHGLKTPFRLMVSEVIVQPRFCAQFWSASKKIETGQVFGLQHENEDSNENVLPKSGVGG